MSSRRVLFTIAVVLDVDAGLPCEMATSHASPKSRYTTGLPSFIEVAEHVPQNVASTDFEPTKNPHDLRLKPHTERNQQRTNVHNLSRDNSTQNVQSHSNPKQAVLLADSLLPYQRPLPANQTKDLAARLILIDPETSSSSDHSLSLTGDSLTERSSSSNSGSDGYEIKKTKSTTVHPFRDTHPINSSANTQFKQYDKQNLRTPPPRYRVDTRDTPASNVQTPVPNNDLKSPAVPARNPERAGFSSPSDIIFKNSVSPRHAIPSVHDSRSTPIYNDSELRISRMQLPSVPFDREIAEGESTTSKRQPRSASPPPHVHYENVEGVELDTKPTAAPERKNGLTIPELEARDIRQIPAAQYDDKNSAPAGTSDSANQESFFRGSPLLSGANRHINAHTVPPRATDDSQGFASSNVNPQVDIARQSELLPKPPQAPADDDVGAVRKSRPMHASHVARHSQSSNTRASFDAPTTIPEDSREDLLDIANDKEEESAEPPPIAMGKEFEEQESRMSRGIQTAKSLLSKML